VFTAAFDGWPTFIAFAAGAAAYVGVALVRPAKAVRTAKPPVALVPEPVPAAAEA
jgi:hypothetical protein